MKEEKIDVRSAEGMPGLQRFLRAVDHAKVDHLHSGPPQVIGYVLQVKDIRGCVDSASVCEAQVEETPTRCPDPAAAERIEQLILNARKSGDSVGGIVECVVRGVPPGLGEPVFDRLEADLAKAVMSLPASKGFEIGSGFDGTRQFGSEHNDEFFVDASGRVRTRTNNSGGVQGGISNGEPVVVRLALKPAATIFLEQETVDRARRPVRFRAEGRHDPCVVPRAVPIVEAMVALVLCDQWMVQKARTESLSSTR